MTKAVCYYEILNVSETASEDEIKRAYRNLALVWHPDKNQANPDEAHAKFQTILKAYETLSDSREREWYDRHKDQILSDGDDRNKESSLNLYQYFSSSCYANYDDAEDGFYSVYRKVFEDLANEEEEAIKLASRLSNKSKQKQKNDLNGHPTFGNSQSEYENIVRPFYAYWSGFCTKLTFDYLDKYNTTEADNRRILRAMEKENKKVKEQAKKERNLNVRNLVEFVKKRDRRLRAHKLIVDQQNEINRQKTAEKQRQQREKCFKESSNYKPTVWDEMNDIEEQLRQLESQYENLECKKARKIRPELEELNEDNDITIEDRVHDNNDVGSCDEIEEDEEDPEYFCPACNKDFKSIKAFENHEASKKHKQNVTKLTKLLKDEETRVNK